MSVCKNCGGSVTMGCKTCRMSPASPASYPIKLVRDGYRGCDDFGLTFHACLDREQHVRLLRQKLIEEAAEYVADPSVGELANVYAVLRALAVVDLGSTPEFVGGVELEQHRERGGFDQGTVMYGPVIEVPRHG